MLSSVRVVAHPSLQHDFDVFVSISKLSSGFTSRRVQALVVLSRGLISLRDSRFDHVEIVRQHGRPADKEELDVLGLDR